MMKEFKLNENKEISLTHKNGVYIIPVIDEDGNEFNFQMTQEDMNKFLETQTLMLTDDCKGVKH